MSAVTFPARTVRTMRESSPSLSRGPRTAAPDRQRGSRASRALPEPAVAALLLIVLLAAVGAASTLFAVEGTTSQAVASSRLARQYDELGADLVQAELLRSDVALGEAPAAALLPVVRARLNRHADSLMKANSDAVAHGGFRDGDDDLFAARVRDYLAVEAQWLTTRGAGEEVRLGEVATALRTSLHIETEQQRRSATAAEDHRKDLMAGLQWGTGPVLLLLLLAAAVAARSANRRRQQLQSAAQDAHWNSLHDPLTGLANRLALSNEIQRRGPQTPVALLWLDLDDFKVVNDAAGHAYGDLVLEAVADRLVEVVRPDDLVARIGGDEFVVLCLGPTTSTAALALAERVAAALRRPLMLAPGPRAVTASIGVAIDSGGDPGRVLVAADAAMYQAKRLGGGGVALFDESLRAAWAARSDIAQALKGAAARGEMRLYYQPLVDLRTSNVRGVEALVRWEHPTRGLLAPDAFIDIAEDTGAIIELGDWVLNEACRVLADWALASSARHDLRISVNVSAKQLTDERMLGSVTRALESTGANPALLTVEVTESAVMADVTVATQTLKDLRALGVHLAIDDFGTGYSSLTYLKQFPIHELKLDKSFVDGVGTNAEDSAIVAAVVNLARAVGLEVIAEGVETLRQSAVLRTLGCDYGQGYLWQRPVPREVIEPWIEAQRLTAGNVGKQGPAHELSVISPSRRPA